MADTLGPNPSDRALPLLGTYARDLPVTLDRMFENAVDWEHLPHLHAGSFQAISCREAGDWGWHCDAVLPDGQSIELELRLDRTHQRWITRTLSGTGAGTEIWSYVFERAGGGIRVVVDFFVPGIPQDAQAQMFAYYRHLYAGLYDEDVAMMTGRQAALEATPARQTVCIIGPEDEVRGQLPVTFELSGKSFQLIADAGQLVAYAALCPHMLGPLGARAPVDGVVTCPWHGYSFDIHTGAEQAGRACRLPTAPTIRLDADGNIVAEAAQE